MSLIDLEKRRLIETRKKLRGLWTDKQTAGFRFVYKRILRATGYMKALFLYDTNTPLDELSEANQLIEFAVLQLELELRKGYITFLDRFDGNHTDNLKGVLRHKIFFDAYRWARHYKTKRDQRGNKVFRL